MKALFTVKGHIFDITGCVADVTASKDGEVKYRGNGMKVYRGNHVNGDAILFIKLVNKEYIFGEWVNIYTVTDNWNHGSYDGYDMEASEGHLVIHGLVERFLSEACAI